MMLGVLTGSVLREFYGISSYPLVPGHEVIGDRNPLSRSMYIT
ncbi:hypothetical protein [Allocoleopsis sp.]